MYAQNLRNASIDLRNHTVLQSSPNGAASLKFTNLLSRLLDQVCFASGASPWLISCLSRFFLENTRLSFSCNPSRPRLPAPHQSFFRLLHPLHLPGSRPVPALWKFLCLDYPGASRRQTYCASIDQKLVDSAQLLLSDTYRFLGRPHLPEHLLLRDTLYLLQGISGKYVRFSIQDDPEQENKLVFMDDSVRSSPFFAFHRILNTS
jgi:gamma-tubulin complex component 3